MKTLFCRLLLVTLLMLPWSAQSRIGETLDECTERYGSPVEVKKNAMLFLKNGIYVSVHFADRKVDEISYYKKDPKDSKKSVSPTDAETEILLQANAQNSIWEFKVAHLHDTLWGNKEEGLSAFHTQQALTISISDPIAYNAHHGKKTAARRLERF
jgi:hypothetical protein